VLNILFSYVIIFIPIDRDHLLNSIIRFEKSVNPTLNQCILSLKDTCTRRLLLLLGDNHQIYKMCLSSSLVKYITYDYLTGTNNNQCQLTNDLLFFSNSKLLFCRDCSLNDLGASKCRRRKCLANRVRQSLHQLSCQIIPWEKRQRFAILENDDDDNTIVFVYLKSNGPSCESSKERQDKYNNQGWIEEQFYLIDLLRILQINMARD
jgi:hypothetical protein